MQLRTYQEKAYSDIREEYRQGKKRVLFVLPTGGGKTYTFTYAAKMAIEKGKTVFFLVHKKNLVKQISASLKDFGIRHGFIAGSKPKQYYLKAQVCSVQSLKNRMQEAPAPDLIIVDEAHHSNAGSWRKILDFYASCHVLGVTATPIRTDGQGLGDIFESMVLGPDILRLIEESNLVMPRIFRPKCEVDLSEVKLTKDGDFNQEQLFKLIDKPKITGDAVAEYMKLCPGAPAVYFCVNVKHCEDVAEVFMQNGIKAAAVYGDMEESEQDRILKGLGSGEIQVVTSCDLISEGTDIPRVGCIGHLRPTMSLGLYMQMNGRGLRPCEGKSECIIIDHVDNFKRHGHPCEPRDWTLEGIKRKKKGKKEETVANEKYNTCTECFAVFTEPDKCPCCGKEVEKKERKLEQVEGELKEVVFDPKAEKKAAKIERGKSQTLEDLWRLKQAKGYKDRWVYFIYESRVMKLWDKLTDDIAAMPANKWDEMFTMQADRFDHITREIYKKFGLKCKTSDKSDVKAAIEAEWNQFYATKKYRK